MSISKTASIDIEGLRARVRGPVTSPSDDNYDPQRKLFYGGIDPHPGALVRVKDAQDVASAIRFVRDNGIELAVRSGGHSIAGHSTVDNGLVIDVRGLDQIQIDAGSRTAWTGTGVTAAEYTNAGGEYGLGTGFGDTGSVGIGGITLGGGVGFLVRKHGLTIDSLLAAEIVTADGEVLMVDENNYPDLFWAIRGGGGNFGVATGFKFALHPVDPFVGGFLMLPGTSEVVQGFVELSTSAPEELSTIANVMTAPPMPFIPDGLVGHTVVFGILAWSGEAAPGLEMMDRFRDLGEPLVDMVDVIPYPQIYQAEDEDYAPTAAALTGFTDEFTERKVSASLDAIASSDAPMRVVQVRALGGAMARVADGATSFAHRGRKLMVNVAAFYEGDEDRARREEWVKDLATVITEGDDTGYVGFLGAEGPDRVRAAYPGQTWERLRRVKAVYDPDNLLHRNQNIPPAV